MPFTVLHLGPGMAIKALAGPRFSLMAFGLAQGVMDVEPLFALLRGASVLHGWTHTYLAALPAAALAVSLTLSVGRPLLRWWNRRLGLEGLPWLAGPDSLPLRPVVAGAALGTLSHVVLDSVMHADMAPLAPWSLANPLYGRVSMEHLNRACLLAGLLGLTLWLLGAWRRRPGR